MRSHLLILTAAGIVAGTLAIAPGARNVSPTGPESPDRPLEVARLQAHFDSVDIELRNADRLQLTSGQRAARATLIGWLQEYRQAGEFPRNDRLTPFPLPFFRDSRGALCAMAYLIERSGRGDLVDRVSLTRNNAFIAELAHDPELRAWLDSVGFSISEAARIQPTYEPPSGLAEDQEVSAEYAVTSILVSGASLATLGLNLIAPSQPSGWAGVIAGSVGLIAGAANLDGTGGTEQVAAANLIIGGGALAAGLYRLFSAPLTRPEDKAPPRSADSNLRLAIGPMVVPYSDGPRFGLAMHGNF